MPEQQRKISEEDLAGVPSAASLSQVQKVTSERAYCVEVAVRLFSTHPEWQPDDFKGLCVDVAMFVYGAG